MKIYIVCFVLAVVSSAAGIILTVFFKHSKFIRKINNNIIIGTGFFIGIAALFFPAGTGIGVIGEANNFFLTIFRALRALLAGEDYYTDLEIYNDLTSSIFGQAYIMLMTLLYLMLPLVAFVSVYSLIDYNDERFKIFSARLMGKNLYVFSSMNSRTLSIAKSIESHEKNLRKSSAFFVFFNAEKKEIDNIVSGYAAFPKPIKTMSSSIFKAKTLKIYFSDNDENINFTDAMALINRLFVPETDKILSAKGHSKPELIIFSASYSHELLINSVSKELDNVHIKLIDEAAQIARSLLLKKELLGYYKRFYISDNDTLNIALVGFGRINEALFKSLLWTFQGNSKCIIKLIVCVDEKKQNEIRKNYPELICLSELKKEGVSGNPNTSDILAEKYPEIVSWHNIEERLNTVSYSVELKTESQLDFEHDRPELVFVDYGNDNNNTNESVRLYEKLARDIVGMKTDSDGSASENIGAIDIKNMICIKTFIENIREENKYVKLEPANHKGESYNIEFIPYSLAYENYSENIMLEEYAKDIFIWWRYLAPEKVNEKLRTDIYRYSYDYRSSISTALFWYIYCSVIGNENNQKEDLGKLEHKRWSVFMRTEGYSYNAQKCDDAKLHNCITPYWKLTEGQQNIDNLANYIVGKIIADFNKHQGDEDRSYLETN